MLSVGSDSSRSFIVTLYHPLCLSRTLRPTTGLKGSAAAADILSRGFTTAPLALVGLGAVPGRCTRASMEMSESIVI